MDVDLSLCGDIFDYILKHPFLWSSSSLLRQAKPNTRRIELPRLWIFSGRDFEKHRYTGTVESPNSKNIRWIGEILWYIAKHAMQSEFAYIGRHIYRSPYFLIPIHSRRLLLFAFSHSSRSAFSAASASFSNAISRFLLSSYAFACLSSAGVRLPVGF